MNRRAIATAALLGAALTLTACNDDEPSPAAESDTSAASTPSEAASSPEETTSAPTPVDETVELRAAAQAYSDAFLTGDGAGAYALLSARCQDRIPEADFTAVVEQAGAQYGSALAFKTFDAQVSGDLARVTYTYDVSALDQNAEPWVREGGDWHEDDC